MNTEFKGHEFEIFENSVVKIVFICLRKNGLKRQILLVLDKSAKRQIRVLENNKGIQKLENLQKQQISPKNLDKFL